MWVSTVVVDMSAHRCHSDVLRIADDCFIVSWEIILVGSLIVEVCCQRAKLNLQVLRDGTGALNGGKPLDGAPVLAC